MRRIQGEDCGHCVFSEAVEGAGGYLQCKKVPPVHPDGDHPLCPEAPHDYCGEYRNKATGDRLIELDILDGKKVGPIDPVKLLKRTVPVVQHQPPVQVSKPYDPELAVEDERGRRRHHLG